MELHSIHKSHKMEAPRQKVHDHRHQNQRDFFKRDVLSQIALGFFLDFVLCLSIMCVWFMGFVCLVYVCLYVCFWNFFSLCVYLFCFTLICLFFFF